MIVRVSTHFNDHQVVHVTKKAFAKNVILLKKQNKQDI